MVIGLSIFSLQKHDICEKLYRAIESFGYHMSTFICPLDFVALGWLGPVTQMSLADPIRLVPSTWDNEMYCRAKVASRINSNHQQGLKSQEPASAMSVSTWNSSSDQQLMHHHVSNTGQLVYSICVRYWTCGWDGCWLLWLNQARMAFALVASDRRALSLLTEAFWGTEWQQWLWPGQQQVTWFLCNCHWVRGSFFVRMSVVTTFCALQLRRERRTSQDTENKGNHYSSKLSVHWQLLPTACYRGVVEEIRPTVSYVTGSGKCGQQRQHCFWVRQQPEFWSQSWLKDRRWG